MLVRRLILLLVTVPLLAGRADRYALILEDPPLVRQVRRSALAAPEAEPYRKALLSKQKSLHLRLAAQQIPVTGSIHTLLNAVFVAAAPNQAARLQTLPGVAGVVRMPALRRKLNKALDLISAPQAWSALGGASNAGAGMKIAILDTGIDETHPAFQDPSLSIPAGFPKGTSGDLAHATNKIIAVRSYVQSLALFDGDPVNTRPDDLSARDRVGHGTAVAMIAAGVTNTGPVATITGVAPKAWLGNYKIFGSPGVNDFTFSDVVLQALDDAFNDGMDVASVSVGFPALWSLHEQGAACGNSGTLPCDPWAAAVENAAAGGMAVVVPAGNDGDLGMNTINTPGSAPSAITAGASTNTHVLFSTVATPSGDELDMRLSDGPQPLSVFSAPLADVSNLNNNGKACSPLPNGSLAGMIALIQRGDCGFATKVINAEQAGAVAAIIFREQGANSLFTMTGLVNTGIPSGMIGADAGALLKSRVAAHPGGSVTFDPAAFEIPSTDPESAAFFASQGPGITDSVLKPEVAAPGTFIYTATQNYDPNGDLFSGNRYSAADGTSLSAPMVAAAAAMAKQAHPKFTAAQLKSAVTNTATGGLIDYDASGNPFPARVTAVGAGKLNVANAIATTITAVPATVSFGEVSGGLVSRTVTITNAGASSANIQLTVNQRDQDARAQVSVNPASFALGAGQARQVTVALTGSIPQPGIYEGIINVSGGPVPLRIPYLYLVGDGVPFNLIPLQGSDFVQESGAQVELDFKVVDRYGVPVANVPVQFSPSGSVSQATRTTDNLGIGEALVNTGPQTGEQSFTASAGGMTLEFDGRVRLAPSINNNGLLNAASFEFGRGLAPGSYLTIKGSGLSETTAVYRTPYLPISLAGVSVSFDAPSRGLSLPGHIHYVSDGQINVQIPWEFAGLSSVIMKVSLGDFSSDQSPTVTVPLATVSPAFFEYQEAASGKTLAAALDENYRVIGTGNPVQRGRVVQFFLNGLGAVDHQPPSGEPTPSQSLVHTSVLPSVMIGEQPASVQFSGLAPTIVGLYQVNVVVPTNISPGFQAAVISIGGVTSKTTIVPVQ